MRYSPLPGFLERPMRVWKNVAARLAKLSPDLTLVTGDLCFAGEKGDPGRLEGQTTLAARAMAMLPAPARALPGNHDARYDQGAADYAVWRAHMGPTRQLFRLPGLAVLLLDNNALGRAPDGRPRNCGRLPAEALNWMEAVLALLPPETHLIAAGHFPLVSPLAGSNPLLYNPLVRSLTGRGRLALRSTDQSAGLIAGLIRRRPVLAVINGHEHAYQNSTLHARGRDFFFLGLPALCGAWWTGDRSFGPLNFAPGYLLTRIKNLPDRPRLDSKFVEVKF
jgi:3',5'-cyclic AMP phosphodiesterase CpdA